MRRENRELGTSVGDESWEQSPLSVVLKNKPLKIYSMKKMFKKLTVVASFSLMLLLTSCESGFNETQKILKAQSSRGVDFKEGTLKQQIGQIISLLIPMLVISFKRAADLADAMEARGYIPGAPRTKLNIMKFRLSDLISFILILIVFATTIVFQVI